ncbi:MAG: energy transducer TonB [Flavobacteriales bacterium]
MSCSTSHRPFAKLILLLLLIPGVQAKSQPDTVMTITKDTDTTLKVDDAENPACQGKTFVKVEQMPSFPGGEEKMQSFLADTLEYPEQAKEKGVEGVVHVAFTICKDGSIKNARVLKGIGNGCDRAALKAVKAMPKWEPGKQKGKKVLVRDNIPVRFEP